MVDANIISQCDIVPLVELGSYAALVNHYIVVLGEVVVLMDVSVPWKNKTNFF